MNKHRERVKEKIIERDTILIKTIYKCLGFTEIHDSRYDEDNNQICCVFMKNLLPFVASAFSLIAAGCATPTIVQVKHSYVPGNGEQISLMDNPCIDQAKDKAKEKLDLDVLTVVDSYVSFDMDAQKRGMKIVCSVDVQLP
jgi:hypothetical protein